MRKLRALGLCVERLWKFKGLGFTIQAVTMYLLSFFLSVSLAVSPLTLSRDFVTKMYHAATLATNTQGFVWPFLNNLSLKLSHSGAHYSVNHHVR